MTLAEEAELWRRGLSARYLTSEEAVAWADGHIERLESPPPSLLEVSLGAARPPEDLARELEPLAGGAPKGGLISEELRLLREVLQRAPERAEKVAWAARDLAFGPLASHRLSGEIFAAAYEFDPSEATWARTADEARDRLGELLTKVSMDLDAAV